MSPISLQAFTVLGVVNTSKSEIACLGVLSDCEPLNAYEIWQKSGYKHYPTILRAVKKLDEKGLIDVSMPDATRNATHYNINFGGLIYYFIISDNVEKSNKLLMEKSLRFRELSEDFFAYRWGTMILNDIYVAVISNEIKNKDYNINSEIERIVERTFADYISDITNEIANDYASFEVEELQKIIEYSKKFNWVYDITQKIVKDGIDFTNKWHITYSKIKAMLESKL